MKFVVIGIGVGGAKLSYQKETLGSAGYTASKMADNGVEAVQIFDDKGKEYSLDDGWKAFRLSKSKDPTFR